VDCLRTSEARQKIKGEFKITSASEFPTQANSIIAPLGRSFPGEMVPLRQRQKVDNQISCMGENFLLVPEKSEHLCHIHPVLGTFILREGLLGQRKSSQLFFFHALLGEQKKSTGFSLANRPKHWTTIPSVIEGLNWPKKPGFRQTALPMRQSPKNPSTWDVDPFYFKTSSWRETHLFRVLDFNFPKS
jgi:hypothetical protein